MSTPSSRSLAVVAALALASMPVAVSARQHAAPSDPHVPAPFGASTTAVTVDVVVRDAKGQPVLDLTQGDFTLYEDGVEQRIGSLTLVRPGPASTAGVLKGTAPARAATETTGAAELAPGVVALVFGELGPEGRAMAVSGARTYLTTAGPHDYAAVFGIDLSLQLIQPYTNDLARLRTAIDRAASHVPTTMEGGIRVRSETRGDSSGDASPTAGASEVGPSFTEGNPGADPRDAPPEKPPAGDMSEWLEKRMEYMARRTELRMKRTFETMVRDQRGYASADALLAIVDSLAEVPGRKTVVYFAESLAITPNALRRFQSVVAAANRANVSIYSMDAGGLRVHSEQNQTAREIAAIGNDTLTRQVDTRNDALTESLEHNEDVLRQDPHVSLSYLADQTGGFLVDGTNDLESAFRRIDADRRFHYLLTYEPTNDAFDGTWRSIAVKVRRKNVEVRARSGYLATRTAPASTTAAAPLSPQERALADALARTPRPADVPLRAGVFSFPEREHPGRTVVLVSAPARALAFEVAPPSYRSEFAILAQIRDSNGAVIRKATQPYRVSGPVAQVTAAQQGDVLFFRQPDLPPGRYTLECALHDALGAKTGTLVVPVSVPPPDPSGLAVSSLVIVRRSERVGASERRDDNPLYVGDLLLYPNLGEPLHRADRMLSFYLAVQPGEGDGPDATLTLSRGGQVVAAQPLPLPPPAPDGTIRHTALLPLGNLAPGTYDLQVTVVQGTARAARTAIFTLLEGE